MADIKKKIFAGLLVGTVLISGLIYYIHYKINNQKPLTYSQTQVIKEYRYLLKGAILHPGETKSFKPLTYGELFKIAGILNETNLGDFNLKKLAPTNVEIYVPFNFQKLRWHEITDVQILVSLGFSAKEATFVYELTKRFAGEPTWDEIIKQQGITNTLVKKLQKVLVLR
ncbi:MAG0490 family ComEA-like DNA-binding protein [Mycoplasma corogypsi]|uniref:MAG0490 family ComEA-like DNA-binding protein n=1 Tax=Mycoplasma corogypsi TaxID=2106 RepID=UPI003873C8C7